MTNTYYAELQAKCDALCEQWRAMQFIDTTGFVDLTEDLDPISAAVLEEDARVA